MADDYQYHSAAPSWSNQYIWPALDRRITSRLGKRARVMDLGCGNGATSAHLARLGFDVVGVDPSESGIEIARAAFPECHFAQRSAYDDLAAEFGTFDAVISLEVIEHCYAPRALAATVFSLLKPEGSAFISTPFHGYWKNLALALLGKFDDHWSPLWDGGHIKFWSERSLALLLRETGFSDISFDRIGRIPPLAKSMLATAMRPPNPECLDIAPPTRIA